MRRLLRAIVSIQPGVVIFGVTVSLVLSAVGAGLVRHLFFIGELAFGGQDWNQALVDRLAAALDEARETVTHEQNVVASIPVDQIDTSEGKALRLAAKQRIAHVATNLSIRNPTVGEWVVQDLEGIRTFMRQKLLRATVIGAAYYLSLFLLGAVAARFAHKSR